MNPKSTHCGLRLSGRPVWKNIIRSKRLINQLLDAIASHTSMEIHGGISSVGAYLKRFFCNVVYFPNNLHYASSPVRSKASLGKEKIYRQICDSFFSSFIMTTKVHFSVSSSHTSPLPKSWI